MALIEGDLGGLAETLQAEARRLLNSSGLLRLLHERFGACSLVGSVDLDLMTWRDIDIYVPVERTEFHRFIEAMPAIHAALAGAGYLPFRLTFNDEWLRPRGDYGSGYYWGLRTIGPTNDVWKLDLWGWERETYEAKLRQHEELKRALAEADRQLVVSLKHEAMQLPAFRQTVTTYDVYRFVLGGRGDTVEQLISFCDAGPNAAAR
jgi:hypothetical protein